MMKLTQGKSRIINLSLIVLITVSALLSGPTRVKSETTSGAPVKQSSDNKIFLPVISVPAEKNWPMAGANPERTSWTPEEVRGALKPLWYKQFEPYIHPKIQIITAYNTLYISTAAGLYALDANTGAEKWVYPTDMPLGHSPTVVDKVAYVGGLDRRLHAVDALTGQGLWLFEAEGGFTTNPLVVNNIVYIGSRDGNLYAIHASGPQAGQLFWKFKTEGSIDISAAHKDGVIFFASNDSHAYALEAQTGGLVWKSAKLPGAGFQTWWPVIYRDWVIFSGSNNYRPFTRPGDESSFMPRELNEVYPRHQYDPSGTLVGPLGSEPGDWVVNTPTIDTSRPTITSNGRTVPVTEYLENKPWRRSYLVLNRFTGQEYTTDFDRDGKAEFAPILWQGTYTGNRYPPVVASDGVIYQSTHYMSNPYIAGGQVVGWKIGTPFISIVSSDWNAVDEPLAYSSGGNLIYWNLCCDREAGAFDVRIPNTLFRDRYNAGYRPPTDGGYTPNREWKYFNYNLASLIPGYGTRYFQDGVRSTFGGEKGVYGFHGVQNPPIPYQGKVFIHRSNAVIAFSPVTVVPTMLPTAVARQSHLPDMPVPDQAALRSRLEDQVGKIIQAGHLRPGYQGSGFFELGSRFICGDMLSDYWHNPSDTIYVLLSALPYLSTDLQTQTRAYIQRELNDYPPYRINHIGWRQGAAREIFELPPEVQADLINLPPASGVYGFKGWFAAPNTFYALWKYAQVFGNARAIFDQAKDRLEPVPSNEILAEMPHVHNAYIAGYLGYLELEKLAGYPESTAIRQRLNQLLELRAANFSTSLPAIYFSGDMSYRMCRTFSASRNFLYMVPELGDYLNQYAYDKVHQAVVEYQALLPYWFVARHDVTIGEGGIQPLYDYHSLFMARALILHQPLTELSKYLDVPAFARGDLYYIYNLVLLLEAYSS